MFLTLNTPNQVGRIGRTQKFNSFVFLSMVDLSGNSVRVHKSSVFKAKRYNCVIVEENTKE